MSFLKLQNECADAETTGAHCLDAIFNDTKSVHDANFCKDVIKRLQEELAKLKTENIQLRETVLAYSIKLPQVSRKLNTLVACLEAKAYKFSRRKNHRSKDEAEESRSSGESTLNGGDDGGCELQDGISEEETSQSKGTAADEGVHQSVQNLVEIICDEGCLIENGSSTKGERNIAAAIQGNPKLADKEKKKISFENNTKPSSGNVRTVTSRNMKLRKLKGSVQQREIRTNKSIRHKKSIIQGSSQNQEVQKFSASFKENETVPEAVSVELQNDMDIKIKMEESLEDSAVLENDVQDTDRRSKPLNQSQESVISSTPIQETTGSTENTSSDTTDLRRRGRRRAYDCEVCGRTFARSSNLAHHVMRHRNERPHQCEICDRAFVQKANLKVHLRSHTGERPFSCNECGRAFAQKNNALRHLRAHARQRQLQEQKLVCPVCGKAFGRWPSYETHMRRAHSNAEPAAIGPITHCIIEGMVNNSHPTDDIGNVSGGTHLPNVGDTMTNSQLPLEASNIENIHSSTVTMVNVPANDNISNGHMPSGHHPQNEHLLVGSHATMTVQLNETRTCSDSAC